MCKEKVIVRIVSKRQRKFALPVAPLETGKIISPVQACWCRQLCCFLPCGSVKLRRRDCRKIDQNIDEEGASKDREIENQIADPTPTRRQVGKPLCQTQAGRKYEHSVGESQLAELEGGVKKRKYWETSVYVLAEFPRPARCLRNDLHALSLKRTPVFHRSLWSISSGSPRGLRPALTGTGMYLLIHFFLWHAIPVEQSSVT